MTTEWWNDDRLDQLASTVAQNSTAIADLRATAEALLQTVVLHQQSLEVSQGNFEVIQTEIRGLQLENRRLIEELRSKREE